MNSSANKVMSHETGGDEGVYVWKIGGDVLMIHADFVDILNLGNCQTYNGQWKKYGRVKTDTDWTFGGYSGQYTVPER